MSDMKAAHHSAPPFAGPIKTFQDDEIIVSKTDLRGRITYVNDVFVRVSGYSERQLMGAAHNIIRHPDMPRSVFKLLWDTIQQKEEIFAYVLNLANDGVGYWVFAHVTPSYDTTGEHVGYHSNRRVPYPDALSNVKSLYTDLLKEERRHASSAAATAAGYALLQEVLASKQTDYAQLVFGLSQHTCLQAGTV
jgi:PAS domain S-box-containing protein